MGKTTLPQPKPAHYPPPYSTPRTSPSGLTLFNTISLTTFPSPILLYHTCHSLILWTIPEKCPKNIHRAHLVPDLGPSQERCVLCGATGHPNQLRWGHCCTCTALGLFSIGSVDPPTAIPAMFNSNHEL